MKEVHDLHGLWGLDTSNHALLYYLVIHSTSWYWFGLIPEYRQGFEVSQKRIADDNRPSVDSKTTML